MGSQDGEDASINALQRVWAVRDLGTEEASRRARAKERKRMSGGHWNYFGRDFTERAKATTELWRLMETIEHELDWGICCDTCHSCARSRLGPALEAFFDSQCTDATVSIALMRDREQNRCKKCAESR